MARRPNMIAKKTKKPRITRSEGFLVNQKYLGEEPIFTKPVTHDQYARALTWYNYMCDMREAREYIETHLKNSNRLIEAKKFKNVPDVWVNTTSAWIARMLSKGFVLPDTAVTFFEEKLKKGLSKITAKVETKDNVEPVQKISIQDRMRERQSEIIGDIEQMIDTGEQFSLYDWLKGKEIPAAYCAAIIAYYSPWLQELIEASDYDDEQLKEAYQHLSKKQLKERILFMSKLIEDAEKYSNVTKKTRAPRKPRAVSKEKLLKHLKYQKEDNTFKIASINPEKILGAQELWTFNTKYKVVTVFRAIDRGGLQVKRSSIVDFDANNSFSKGCGRKPELVLDKLQNGGKIVLKKLMDEMKTDKPLQERINENTILIKVVM